MGGVLTLFVEMFSLAEDLSLATGFTAEAILTGEAAAAVAAEATWLIEVGAVDVAGLSVLEALTLTGITAEQFSLLSALPITFSNAIGIGVFFPTVTGASALVAAGVTTFGYSKDVPLASMALVPWMPEIDYLFPGLTSFSYYLNIVADWWESLFHVVGREIWRRLLSQAHRQLGEATRAIAVRSQNEIMDMIARIAENARWAVTNGPVHLYSSLENYYRELPGINPAQLRQQYRFRREAAPSITDFRVQDQQQQREVQDVKSGHYVEHYGPPGGAHQRVTPDWMLPLILGLYGDITPTWEVELHTLEEQEDGPRKKKARMRAMS
ncbi:VP2 structural protein [Tree shrew polyomavirus 1]|uniref:Minor capsid protein n=2 Tax=Tree shrew polyomavirus 1 TaxID=2562517 RepID=A0A6P1E7K0_9POLY|nr:VP2 structural protein [Tree shrew polyomavirus 1]QBR53198.1 VP2 structural protein [Tree shrew polyomavirus 1]